MSDAFPRGRFVWHDLMTTDPGAAKAFYHALARWGTTTWEGGDLPYDMWTNDETPIGGVMQLPDEAVNAGASPHWLAYVATPDVDVTVSRAEQMGASVMVPPRDIPAVGRFAVLNDPQGAMIACFMPAEQAPGHDGPPQRGEFSWRELITGDQATAFEFYSVLFGWEKTDAMDMGDMGIYQMYGRLGMPLGGMFNKPADQPGSPASWLAYVMVDDVKKRAKQVKKLGGQVLNGPMEVPGGDFVAQCLDPQGAAFAIHATKKE